MPSPRPTSKPASPAPSSGPSTGKARGYFAESLQPIYSAALVLPFLLVYEIGLFLFRSDVINGGDAIMINLGGPLFHRIGIEGSLVSLVFLGLAFLYWQFKRKGTWTINPPILSAMFFESLFYAVILFLMLGFFVQHFGSTVFNAPQSSAKLAVCAAGSRNASIGLKDFVLFCGAGVFEELVFRVLLLGLLMLVLTKLLHMEHAYAAAWAVLLGAAIFSAFHHMGSGAEPIVINVFLQRLLAGLYFSALFFNRGFGIAAASHALYDILVGLNQMRN